MKLRIGIDSKTYEVEVEVVEDDFANVSHAVHHPAKAQAPVPSPAPQPVPLPPPGPLPSANDAKVCRSPIVGLVTKVLVRAGQQLKVNDRLVVLEAMKMESNITAPVDGIVARVNVKPGDAVQTGQVLVEFE